MHYGTPHIGSFYHTGIGQVFTHILGGDIKDLLPRDAGSRWAIIGYPFPVLADLAATGTSPHCVAISGRLGGGIWPQSGANRTVVVDEGDWPLASHSLDALVILHGLEFAPDPAIFMAEAARVLVGQGTVIVIAANRRSLWSSMEWSPWGHGQPFTANQLQSLLHDNGLNITAHVPAIFIPPLRWRPIWRMAQYFERIGRLVCPALPGVHIFAAKKQTLAGIVIPANARRGAMQPGRVQLSGAQASVQEPA
ncbi:MAG: methyltransferase domain-containing protein [Pseudomonadota bacterium]